MSSGDAFVPKDLIECTVSVAGSSAKIMMYPFIIPGWKESEKAHNIRCTAASLSQQRSMTAEEKIRNFAVSTDSQSTVMTIMSIYTWIYNQTKFCWPFSVGITTKE